VKDVGTVPRGAPSSEIAIAHSPFGSLSAVALCLPSRTVSMKAAAADGAVSRPVLQISGRAGGVCAQRFQVRLGI
jgi:hypothetical protein